MKKAVNTDLTHIPGIGANMAEHLRRAGYPDIPSLRNQDPQEIYIKDCIAQGMTIDRCALYCYRLAVHYANHQGHLPPGKENWWNWKD